MRGVNKVILVGTLGRDPETKTFPNGGKLCQFSIATSEKWKDKNSGEWKEITEWHRIVVNDKLAEIAQQYLKQGSQVYVEGSLRTRKWTDQSGVEKYATEVRCSQLQMIGGKPQEQGSSNGYSNKQNQQKQAQKAPVAGGGTSSLDDDLPFAPVNSMLG